MVRRACLKVTYGGIAYQSRPRRDTDGRGRMRRCLVAAWWLSVAWFGGGLSGVDGVVEERNLEEALVLSS